MTVTVFTKPYCPQCDATKRQLTKLGVPFETVDLAKKLAKKTAPVAA